ncbi:DUF3558 domain-containing protein [Rhodococcus sp. D2-41]|uniref:DUF3558 domain-containing protein n=1 Tax=Speluncibacter jeojiensis TaxID=2710754 RepID=A0A9X4RDM0_9ACTN|nr:DUF3558 domain-containing protein [Rhodococcus sp. D2-41]MDG3012276.1 DUF3558 domain-containing protein [Rhodococcus sp. D2-41]MDG3014753.1 DUF3558 domain-containing protein [Corynebacteriales bacterium D3-21]
MGVLALAVAAVLSGCSSPSTGTAAPTTSATAAPTTTRTPRITDNSGRPPVAFDPCLDLSDAQITQLGYRPETRRKTDFPAGDYTFLSCSFNSSDFVISISSGNVGFAEEQAKEKRENTAFTPTVIDKRQALTIPEDGGCSLAMQTSYGIVILTRTSKSVAPDAPSCEGIEDTARLISQFMPAGT